VGRAIAALPQQTNRKFGIVGLGTGTMAAYGQEGDTVRFYDINTAVERLATSRFTYVTGSPAKVDVVIGDARLSLESELAEGDRQNFDLLVLDAFSSDAIPVHLLTREAFDTYFAHMKPDGVIAVHISNRYLQLQPVVEAIADEFGYPTLSYSDSVPPDEYWLYRSSWVLVTRNEAVLNSPLFDPAYIVPRGEYEPVLWTDDYASIFKVLRKAR